LGTELEPPDLVRLEPESAQLASGSSSQQHYPKVTLIERKKGQFIHVIININYELEKEHLEKGTNFASNRSPFT
jgi:hypothetical protein